MEVNKTVLNISKDLSEIHARLFDHRPFLNGEIRNFLQEFEVKKGNDSAALGSALTQLYQSREDLFHRTERNLKAIPEFLQELGQTADSAEQTIQRLISREQESKTEGIHANKDDCQKRWEDCKRSTTEKMADLDKKMKEEEIQLEKYYKSLEEKSINN